MEQKETKAIKGYAYNLHEIAKMSYEESHDFLISKTSGSGSKAIRFSVKNKDQIKVFSIDDLLSYWTILEYCKCSDVMPNPDDKNNRAKIYLDYHAGYKSSQNPNFKKD